MSAEPGAQTLERLVGKLRSRYVGERMDAQRELAEIGPAAVDGLLDIITREQRNLRRRKPIYRGLVIAFCALGVPAAIFCLVMCILCALHGQGSLSGVYGGMIGTILGGFGGGVLGGFSWLNFPSLRFYHAADALSKIADKRAAGALASAVSVAQMNPEVRVSIAETLMRLLPDVTPADADLLDEDARASLRNMLKKGDPERETDFLITIMEALTRVGDVRALPLVQKLAALPGSTPNLTRLQEAASVRAALLEEMVEHVRSSETLVRPSQPVEPADTLLRAAHGAGSESADLLLRPSASEAE